MKIKQCHRMGNRFALTHLLRIWVEELNQCLRYSSEKDWMPWVMEDVTHDVKTCQQDWMRLLAVGSFAIIRIEEDDEQFILTQDPAAVVNVNTARISMQQPQK